jgi:DNA-binding response OmpR family regulator
VSAPAFCPCCGYNFTADETVERDGFKIDPRSGSVWFHERPVHISRARALILHSLATANGPVMREALLARVSDVERVNTLSVQVSHLRRTLKTAGLPSPVMTQRGRGYVWQVAA